MSALPVRDGQPLPAPEHAAIDAPHSHAWWTALPTAVALVAAIVTAVRGDTALAPVAAGWMIAWFTLSLGFSLWAKRHFVSGFLGGLLFLLAGWRLAGPLGLPWISGPALLALCAYLLRFGDALCSDRRRGPLARLSVPQWQLALLRIYVAFDMVPHFTEKLFAGPIPFHEDALILAHYGMSQPALFVVVGGLCELAIAIGLGLGLLTRVAAAGAVLYFLLTSLIGHHFSRGFIWNLNGGGWEYPLLMMIAFAGFIFSGGGRFSIDDSLANSRRLPHALRRLSRSS